jgi:hypothetical protein
VEGRQGGALQINQSAIYETTARTGTVDGWIETRRQIETPTGARGPVQNLLLARPFFYPPRLRCSKLCGGEGESNRSGCRARGREINFSPRAILSLLPLSLSLSRFMGILSDSFLTCSLRCLLYSAIIPRLRLLSTIKIETQILLVAWKHLQSHAQPAFFNFIEDVTGTH